METRKLTDAEVDRLIQMLRSGRPRYEIIEELGLPYHLRNLIPDHRLKDYDRACKSGRVRRYRERRASERAKVRFGCPMCGVQYIARVHWTGGRYELELIGYKDELHRILPVLVDEDN